MLAKLSSNGKIILALCILLWAINVIPSPAQAASLRTEQITVALKTWNQDLTPADRHEKYRRMVLNAFTFYRGSNHLFWQDFANDARLGPFSSPETTTWLQGDLHTQNFGSFQDDQGTIVYDVNDFDEAAVADYQYDVVRLATSLLLMVANDPQVEFSPAEEAEIIDAFTRGYLTAMQQYAQGDDEINLVFTAENTYGRLDNFLVQVAEKKQARRKLLKNWTNRDGNSRSFDVEKSSLQDIDDSTETEIRAAWPGYLDRQAGNWDNKENYFTIKSIAQRLGAGIGSYGTQRYYLLIEGETDSAFDDRILDIKAQGKPSMYSFLGNSFHFS